VDWGGGKQCHIRRHEGEVEIKRHQHVCCGNLATEEVLIDSLGCRVGVGPFSKLQDADYFKVWGMEGASGEKNRS